MPAVKLNLAQDELAQLADFQRRHRVSLMCMVCTELLNASRLRQKLGDAETLRVIRQHDQILRDLLSSFPGGLEISASGGAFFLVFEKPSDAVRFGLQFQIRIGILARKLGQELAIRTGIHVGEVLVEQTEDNLRPGQLNGLQVDTCLALQSLAGPGQILLSRFAFENAQSSLKASPLPEPRELVWASHGTYELLTLGGTLDVCEVAALTGTPPRPPKDNERARRLPDQPEATDLGGAGGFATQTTFLRRMLDSSAAVRRSAGIGAVVTALLGAIFLLTGWLDSASYDLAYLFRSRTTPDEVVVVEMDSESHLQLNQPSDDKWDRRLHAQLLAKLQAAGAKAVGFDIAFTGPARDPAEDAALRAALQLHGGVVLGAAVDTSSIGGTAIVAPLPLLREAAQWGIVERSVNGRSVRRPFGGYGGRPAVTQALAKLALGRDLTPPANAWLNYYGPPGTIAHRSFVAVLSNEVPASAFTNRVVYVGANAAIGYSGKAGTDYLRSPYTLWTGLEAPGVEVNATSYANLVRGDWLRRLPPWLELLAILLAGGAAGYSLVFVDPARSLLFGLVTALIFGLGLMAQVWVTKFWFPWLVLSAVEIPVAVTWAVVARTRLLVAEDRKLRKYLVARRPGSVAPPSAEPSPTLVAGGTLLLSPAEQARAGVNSAVPAIPDHEMLKCIGKGAYGEVWLARDIIGS